MRINDDEQPAPAVEETAAPPPAAKPKRVRKAKAAAPVDGAKAKAKAKAAPKAAKAAPKAAAKAAKGKKAAPKARQRAVDPNKMDQFGYRKGSLRSRAAHIYAAKKGATLHEAREKLGTKNVQFNVLTELEKRGFKVDKTDERNRNGRTVTRYHLHAQ